MKTSQLAIVLLLTCFLSLKATTPDSTIKSITPKRIKEFHFAITDVSHLSLGLLYKVQIKNNNFFKIGFINLNTGLNKEPRSNGIDKFDVVSNFYSIGGQLGYERRKQIRNKLTFYHGPQAGFDYQQNKTRTYDPKLTKDQQIMQTISQSFTLGYSIGLLHQINSNFLIGGDVNPFIGYNFTHYKYGMSPIDNVSREGVFFNMNTRIMRFVLVYRL